VRPVPAITAAMCAYGRTLAEPRLSPDGEQVAFLAASYGRAQLVVVPAAGGPEQVLTAAPPPRAAPSYGGGCFDWVPGTGELVYVAGDGGLWVVPVDGGAPRALPTRGPAAAPAVSPDGRWVAHVVDGRDVAVVALDGEQWPVRLSVGADFCFDPAWTADGTSVVWHEWDVPDMPWDGGRLLQRAADGSGRPVRVAGGEGVQVQQPRPGPDGRLAYLSDASGWLNVCVDGEHVVAEPAEHGDPSWGPGQRSFCWSPDGTQLAFNRNEAGFGRLCVAPSTRARTGGADAVGVVDVAKGVHGGLSWVGRRLAAVRSGARTPTQLVVYEPDDRAGWRRTVLAHGPVAGFEAAGLSEPEAVTWRGDDGGTVHGRWYRPAAGSVAAGAAPPLITWIHGGPTGQWPVTWNARIAYFTSRGWAVLVPDHRGSTGFGRAYTQALRGRWGELDVADVAAGMRHGAEQGWWDGRRMAVMGGSAGGFTVLHLLAAHPELCAAGVDLYGVADLFDLAETTHRFEAHYLDSLVGPLPEAAARYAERSPVRFAGRITTPLLILQGADDVVVPPAQSAAIADAVRAAGGIVEHHVYPNEGHGWARPETVVDELERVTSFLRRHVLRWRAP